MLTCDLCARRDCLRLETEDVPKNCPSKSPVQQQAKDLSAGQDRFLDCTSHLTIKYGYGRLTRVEEIMAFAAESGFKKIGVAFCITLENEARIFCDVLRDNGFAVESILCKNGAIPRDYLGEPALCETRPGMEKALCNPVGQALMLNDAHTDLNVILGLCVGHDSLFMKHSDAPVTYLAVKDRVTGHNPLAPLYQHDRLFKRIHHVELPAPYTENTSQQGE